MLANLKEINAIMRNKLPVFDKKEPNLEISSLIQLEIKQKSENLEEIYWPYSALEGLKNRFLAIWDQNTDNNDQNFEINMQEPINSQIKPRFSQ